MTLEPRTLNPPTLLGCLHTAVACCRNARQPLSLLVIELEGRADLAFAVGVDSSNDVLQAVRSACERTGHEGARCIQIEEARFALLLPDCDRQRAVRIGDDLIATIRQRLTRHAPDAAGLVSLNAGAAAISLPPKNFSPSALLDAADRCLYAARSSGGDSVKSIEVY